MTIRIRRIPGSLCKDPTDLSTAYPHGGTDLGAVRDMVFKPQAKTRGIPAEEFGPQLIDLVLAGENAIFGVVFRDLNDDDWISTVFPSAGTGDSGRALLTGDPASGTRAGTLLSTRSAKLFFSPDSVDQHQGVLIYKALPLPEESAQLQLSIGQEVGVAAMFHAIPSSAHSNQTYQFGRVGDLTL